MDGKHAGLNLCLVEPVRKQKKESEGFESFTDGRA